MCRDVEHRAATALEEELRALKAQHPDWTGDQLYYMAKAVTAAEYQNIIYKEYLPAAKHQYAQSTSKCLYRGASADTTCRAAPQ
jgi:hypothetical protein